MTTHLSMILTATLLLSACGSLLQVEQNGDTTTYTLGEAEQHVDVQDDRLVIDRHINFATNDSTILEDSFDLLDYIAVVLREHGEIAKLEVVGHTDDVGNDDDNLGLSERRAAAVVEALRERGVTQNLDSRGSGESEPLCEETTDACRAQNRRVELLIETTGA